MPGFFWIDPYYLYMVLPAILLCSWAQIKVKTTFNRYSNVHSSRGYTAKEVAVQMLKNSGLSNIAVTTVPGELTDYYDPKAQVVRLSESVYNSTSVAAIGVAAHEVGHACQHSANYAPMVIRNAIVPVCQFGSKLSFPLILLGFFMGAQTFVNLGIILFSLVTLFQLIALPVEYNATRRAMAALEGGYILDQTELKGAKKVLGAAALTYIGALLVSLMSLLRLIILFGGRGNRDN